MGSVRDLAVYTLLAVWLGGGSELGAGVSIGISGVGAQSVGSDGCLRLLGSVSCPGFQYAYVHPQNLSNAWPWLAGVTTVSQFDVAALNYFVNPDQFQQTKFVDQLGCTNATGATLRWERSVLCSQWVNSQWGRACTALYNGTSAATSQKMICQSTCLEYSASERQIVNSTFCPGPAPTDGTRESRLLKDYVDCTQWTTLATNNTETCVQGIENEGNCGYGTSTGQLCDHCRGNSPDDCCYEANVDQSVCGFALPARPSSSSSSASPSSTSGSASPSGSTAADQANSGTGNGTSLTNGQLAGTIVGSILGGLLLLALLVLLLLCLRRRRRDRAASSRGVGPEMAAARPTSGGAFSSMFGGSSSPHPGSMAASGKGAGLGAGAGSEKALLGANAPAGMSSPTMQGSIAQGGKGMLSSGSLGVPAAAAGAGAGAGALAAAGAGAAVGGRTGNVLPRVKDENQDGERFIEQGGEVTVLWPYTATLPDELDLRPGMRLRVVRLYDDAWGTGQVISSPDGLGGGAETGRQGAFPIVCVSEGSSFGSSRSDGSSGGA